MKSKSIAVVLTAAIVFVAACDLPVPQTQPPTVEPSVNTNLVPSVPTEQAQELVDETEKNCRRVVANFVKRRHGDAALVDLKILKIAAQSGESYRFNYQVWVSGDLENKDVGLDERCSIISAPEPLPTSTPTLTPIPTLTPTVTHTPTPTNTPTNTPIPAPMHTATPASRAIAALPCATDGAVLSPQDNPGLVADCTVLLQARDTLSGRATLNWRADLHLFDWDGITISGSPRRVTALELSERQLTGTIPPQLGVLSHLERLALSHNQLIGPIPPQLGALTRLQHLDLGFNQLTGPIPPQLGSLASLQELWLHINELTGPIPSQLGALSQLRELSIGFNQLSGTIPPELGTLIRLEVVGLHVNRLTGPIPPELGSLTKLVRLYIRDNALTGCLPPALRGVASNDFDKLGLPFCPTRLSANDFPAPPGKVRYWEPYDLASDAWRNGGFAIRVKSEQSRPPVSIAFRCDPTSLPAWTAVVETYFAVGTPTYPAGNLSYHSDLTQHYSFQNWKPRTQELGLYVTGDEAERFFKIVQDDAWSSEEDMRVVLSEGHVEIEFDIDWMQSVLPLSSTPPCPSRKR